MGIFFFIPRDSRPLGECRALSCPTATLSESAYEAIVCMETIAHVPDQGAFAARIIEQLAPGGKLILTTQNPYVWHRTSWLEPTKPGQLRNWPTAKNTSMRLASARNCSLPAARTRASIFCWV